MTTMLMIMMMMMMVVVVGVDVTGRNKLGSDNTKRGGEFVVKPRPSVLSRSR